MKTKIIIASLLLGSLLFLTASANASTLSEPLQEAINRYEYGAYRQAIDRLKLLLYPVTSLDKAETEIAHAYIGVCYFLTDQRKPAAIEFRRLLKLNSDYRLDPVLFPPEIIDFFALVVQKTLPPEKRTPVVATLPPGDAEPYEGNLGLAFFPFGVGQFQNDQTFKGLVFFASELVLGGVSISYYFARKKSQVEAGEGGAFFLQGGKYSNPEAARQMQNIQVITGAAFWVVAIWGVADAIYYFYENKDDTEVKVGVSSGIDAEGDTRISLKVDF